VFRPAVFLDGMNAAWKTAGHQIVPTILRLLGLSPTELKAVRMEVRKPCPQCAEDRNKQARTCAGSMAVLSTTVFVWSSASAWSRWE
jgi:hypothetical protein